MTMRKTKRRPQLKTLLKKWLRRFRMSDWDATIEYAWQHEMGNGKDDPDDARVEYDECRKVIAVFIARQCLSGDRESSIIHEILHSRIDPVTAKGKEGLAHDVIYDIEYAFKSCMK